MKKTDDSTQIGRLLIAANAKYPHIQRKADLCRHLKLPQQVITNWNSRGIPSEQLWKLSEEFSCSKKWLEFKEGDMFDGIVTKEMRDRIKKLAGKILLLDDEDFERLLRFCEDLIRSKKN